MTSWLTRRASTRSRRRLTREIDQLARAATGPEGARTVARDVRIDLAGVPRPTTHVVARAVAARCADDGQRSMLAAYLHLCRGLSLDGVGTVFGIDAPAARRLVERGTGAAPVTSGDDCRGWALVLPRAGRTAAEQQAASGHLALCRRCRNRLRAQATLEQRVAVAGTTTLGVSVVAAVGRVFAGAPAATSAAGALTGPVVALSTAAVLTAGVGGFAIAMHGGRSAADTHAPRDAGRNGPATRPVDAPPAAVTRPVPSAPGLSGSTAPAAPPLQGPARSTPLPLPGTPLLPLPKVTATTPPLPLPAVTAPPLPAPTTSPLPLPTLTLPPLP